MISVDDIVSRSITTLCREYLFAIVNCFYFKKCFDLLNCCTYFEIKKYFKVICLLLLVFLLL